MENMVRSGYTVYNDKIEKKTKINLLTQTYRQLHEVGHDAF